MDKIYWWYPRKTKKNIFKNADWGRFDLLKHRRVKLCATPN